MKNKMKKVTIEVEIPDNLDLQHCLDAVDDALYLPENVTNAEYLFVTYLLSKIYTNVHNNESERIHA